MEVASSTVACALPGMPLKQCLQVRDVYYDNNGVMNGTSTWRPFYPNIEGYRHDGMGHILRLKRYNIANPAVNAPNQAYVMDMVVQ